MPNRATVMNARWWASTLSTEQLRRDIPHCRKLRDCFFITRRYDVYYAVLLGVYRAALRQREATEAS